MHVCYTNILGTPEHETKKYKMRARYTNSLGTPHYDRFRALKRKLHENMTVCSNDFSNKVNNLGWRLRKVLIVSVWYVIDAFTVCSNCLLIN